MRLLSTVAVACLFGTVSAEPENLESTVGVGSATQQTSIRSLAKVADELNEAVEQAARSLQESTDDVQEDLSIPRRLQGAWDQLRSMLLSMEPTSAADSSGSQDNFLSSPLGLPATNGLASYMSTPVNSLTDTFLGLGEGVGRPLGLGESNGGLGLVEAASGGFGLADVASGGLGLTEKARGSYGLPGVSSGPLGLADMASAPFNISDMASTPLSLADVGSGPLSLAGVGSGPLGLADAASSFGLPDAASGGFGLGNGVSGPLSGTLGLGGSSSGPLGLVESTSGSGFGMLGQGLNSALGPMTDAISTPFANSPLGDLQDNIKDFSAVASSVANSNSQFPTSLSHLVDGSATPFDAGLGDHSFDNIF